MGKKLHYVRFDFDAFDKATSNLSEAEVGVYLRLLIAYYQNQGPLPAWDWDGTYRRSRVTKARTRAICDSILERFFDLVGDDGHGSGPRWRQRKADEMLMKIKEISAARAEASGLKSVKQSVKHGSTIVSHKREERSNSKANAAFRTGTISEKSTVGGSDFDGPSF